MKQQQQQNRKISHFKVVVRLTFFTDFVSFLPHKLCIYYKQIKRGEIELKIYKTNIIQGSLYLCLYETNKYFLFQFQWC